jgi:hypothetical protein
VNTFVIRDGRNVYAAIVRETSEAAALQLAYDRYVMARRDAKVTPVAEVPDSELSDVLWTALGLLREFLPTVDLLKVIRELTTEQVREEVEHLAMFVTDCQGSHPWLRARTEYDDAADREYDHWTEASGLDGTRGPLDKGAVQVRRDMWNEIKSRYETARLSGLPVPAQYVEPKALISYREEKQSLFDLLRQRKAAGDKLVMDQDTLKRLVDMESRSLYEVACLFGTSIKDICELLPEEKPRRKRGNPPETGPKTVSDEFEKLIYETDLGTVENDLRTQEVPGFLLIPVSRRTSTLFSVYMSNYEMTEGQAFATLVAEMAQMVGMIIHQLGPTSHWKPREAAMMDLAKLTVPGSKTIPEQQRLRMLNEVEDAAKLLEKCCLDQVGAPDHMYAQLLRACSSAAAFLRSRSDENGGADVSWQGV